MAKILLLGGTGFIGSYITKRFLKDGHTVTSIDNMSKYGSIEYDFFSDKNFKMVKKDIRSTTIEDYKGYDYVFCLAALIGGIGYLQKIPYQIAKVNSEILFHAIDCTREASPNATFVFFSSSMIYQKATSTISEKEAYDQKIPTIAYGLQKLFGEVVVTSAHREFGLNYVIVRPFNVVGGGEPPKLDSKKKLIPGSAHVVPDFVFKALKKESPFEIMGDGKQVRTLTHVEDFADAIGLIVSKGVKNEDFNICGDNMVSVGDLAKRTWEIVNPKVQFPGFKHLDAPRDDVRFRVANTEKARHVLGWKPKRTTDDIIRDSLKTVKASL
jgi:UDP-glucose 4-epimerase